MERPVGQMERRGTAGARGAARLLDDQPGSLGPALGPAFVREPRDLDGAHLTRFEDDRPAVGARGKLVVVIPAHNEDALISEALQSLAAQTRLADEVIVVSDRSDDHTVPMARLHGAAVWTTVGNEDRKAGALNQHFGLLLARLSDLDAVLVMDADTTLSPDFLAEATRRLTEPERRAPVAGVGGIFFGYPVAGLLGHLQNNEYVRYARDIGRREGRADVLTGTATLFSVRALRDVAQARADGRLPSGTAVYDVEALTEDNELTLALKHLGYVCVSPAGCTVGTELMPTAARLSSQRLRWQRGALENLLAYGMSRVTLPYVIRQVMTYAAVAFVPFFLVALGYTWATNGSVPWSWFWLYVTGFVAFERVWAVKRGGWRSVGLAALLVPEVVYDLFLHGVYTKALTDTATGGHQTWNYRKPAEARIAGAVWGAGLLAGVVASAFVCIALGIVWAVIAGFVLAGAAAAAVRLSGLDPLGRLLALDARLRPGPRALPTPRRLRDGPAGASRLLGPAGPDG